ncbi:MAG: bifunctional 4-hydroxy-2-oxoglutarate aldolase/2-dehydro-3-deoxy-phosphogluconate aldolase [Verrucomicrobiota bacterium]
MNLTTELNRARILSAAVIDDPAHAVPLARALLAGGLGIMEVTFRNAHAAECILRIRSEVPEMIVGAGTLLTPAQIDEALAAGAGFGVSPGFNPTVVRHAVAADFPFAPGVLTPGEMEQSLELGCPAVKFFPAAAAGGPDFIKAIAAPYAHTALRMIPLGGIGEHNLAEYLELPLVVAVGGSWLTDRKLAATGNWEEITLLTKRAMELARPVVRIEVV